MATEEIDKFVRKFKDLWKLGFDAHLDVDAHAGEAYGLGSVFELEEHKVLLIQNQRDLVLLENVVVLGEQL